MEEKSPILEYIDGFEGEARARMLRLREIILEEAPEAKEKISWEMPTFDFHGNLVHFAMQKKHIGLYPGENGVAAFLGELGDYVTRKGTIQLPMDRPLPEELVRRITRFRREENLRIDEERKERRRAAERARREKAQGG